MEEPQNIDKSTDNSTIIQEQSINDLPTSSSKAEESLNNKQENDCVNMELATSNDNQETVSSIINSCENNEQQALNKLEMEVARDESMANDTSKQVICEESKECNETMSEINEQATTDSKDNESEPIEPMEMTNEKESRQETSNSVVVLNVASSLGAIASAYGDSEDEEESGDVQATTIDKVESLDTSGMKEYRKPVEVSESSDSEDDSSSSEESSKSSSDSDNSEDESLNKKQQKKNNTNVRRERVKKTEKGEYDDLPPIEDLKISMPEVLCDPLGEVSWMVDQLVIVKPKPGKPTLNIDTVLFIEKGKRVLGQIFEVFGQVTDPHYAVRFNNAQHIVDNNIKTGMVVYYCPNTPHTSLVFVTDLTKMKATEDLDDDEVPQFSDDEEERAYYENLKKQPGKPVKRNDSNVPEKRRRTQNKPAWKQKHPWNTNAQYRPRESTANVQASGHWPQNQMPNYHPHNPYMVRNPFGHNPPHQMPYNQYAFGQSIAPPRGPPSFYRPPQINQYPQSQSRFPPPNTPWEQGYFPNVATMYPGQTRPPTTQPDSNFPS